MGMTITEVTVDGDKIVAISVVKSIGGGTDEELLRSINSIPSELIMKLSRGKKGKTTIPLPVLFAISTYSKSNVILIQEEKN